jgi:Protein of unknown function (DUF3147)
MSCADAGQDSRDDDDRVRIEPGAVRQIGLAQAAIRFGAGAAASLVAALVSHFAGAPRSGPLLALPAILIASLTLIADEDGKRAAIEDARGAVVGGGGLVAFAVVAALLLGRAPTWSAVLAATATWVAVSLLLYAAWHLPRARRQPARQRRGAG